jgi:hypothetical protein
MSKFRGHGIELQHNDARQRWTRAGMLRFAGRLARNLRFGGRLCFFRTVHWREVDCSLADLIALILFNLLVAFLRGLMSEGLDGEFVPDNLPDYVFFVALGLLAAAFVGIIAGRRDAALLFAVMAETASWPFELVGAFSWQLAMAIWEQPPEGFFDWNYGLLVGWAVMVHLRILRQVLGGTLRQRLLAMVPVLILVYLPPWQFPRGELWEAPVEIPTAEDIAQPSIGDEALFHAQFDLLRRAGDALHRGTPGVTELYFIGFAPDMSEAVFMRELTTVRELFETRFGARGRTLNLINHPQSLADTPVATLTNLRQALKAVANKMNRDEDILFLFITGHGSDRHQLSVRLDGLNLQQISPSALREALNEAGIRWRVLVISACYSGGFVAPLQDDFSLIITAADATRTSFGCSNEADFTYFGRAYFDQALRREPSFIRAFDLAAESVARRERSEGLMPSLPQRFVAAGITKKLAEFEATLPRSAIAPAPVPK